MRDIPLLENYKNQISVTVEDFCLFILQMGGGILPFKRFFFKESKDSEGFFFSYFEGGLDCNTSLSGMFESNFTARESQSKCIKSMRVWKKQ